MIFSKHRNHRNQKYLDWLRSQNCAVSGDKAQCAHHIRLKTNGGSGIKPSDYFCIPLTNEYHTTGSFALHIIGEESFLNHFKLNPSQLFSYYLSTFLKEQGVNIKKEESEDHLSYIARLIESIESMRPKKNTVAKTPKKQRPKTENIKVTFKGNEYYEKAKELKRAKDKQMRKELKKLTKKKPEASKAHELYHQKIKEAQKEQQRKQRQKYNELARDYRKEQYQRLKEFRKNNEN